MHTSTTIINFRLRSLTLAALFVLVVAQASSQGQVSVYTQHNDNYRTGANMAETTLTTSNVAPLTFGKLFTLPVDGYLYAQPLYVASLPIAGAIQNVAYIATAHDSVYAFNADNGNQLWHVSLGPSVPASVTNTANMLVEVGITGTPVIDPSTNTIYVCAKTYENNVSIYRLHALDLVTGAEKFGGPTLISFSAPGTGDGNNGAGQIPFLASTENQRPALSLVNGNVYIAFASYSDHDPYHGWVLAYSASTLQLTSVFDVTANGGEGGIWQSGQGLVADSANNLYTMTGNSTQSEENSVADYGESFVKLTQTGSTLAEADYFKPNNYDYLNAKDKDISAGGPVGIPGTNFIIGGGKMGLLYLVNTTNMGGLNVNQDQATQEFQGDNGLWGSPVYWNSATPTLYVWGSSDHLNGYSFANGLFNTTATTTSNVFSPNGIDPCPALAISSNGSVAGSGIVWAAVPSADPLLATVPGGLYAFDARNLATELWDSHQNVARDDYGLFAKFDAPTVVNGKVYVPTNSSQVAVYGLLPQYTSAPAAPVITATPGDALTTLSWNAPATAATYTVMRGTTSGGPYATVVSGITATTYVDGGLTNGTTYYYVVTATNNFGPSVNSNEASSSLLPANIPALSIDFVGGKSTETVTPMLASESAGMFTAANWNDAIGATGSLSTLTDNQGNTSGAVATWAADGVSALPVTGSPGNAHMMIGYLDTPTGTDSVTVSLSNLPSSITANGYNVYVYADGNNASDTRAGAYSIGSTTIGLTDKSRTNFNGTFTQANNSIGNYVEFTNVTGSSFTLTATPTTSSSVTFRSPVNGIQIVANPTLSTTTASVTGTAGTNGWYKSPVTVTLTATQGTFPVSITKCTLDGVTSTYTSPIKISTDAAHTLAYWSVDAVGDIETAHNLPINIDSTAPVVTFGTATPTANASGWNNAAVSLPFTAQDATSGVGSTNPVASPLTFSAQGAGQTQTVTATDVAGNSATFTSPAVNIDLTAPATSSTLNGSTVTLSATDALSGVAATYYTIDSGTQQTYAMPIVLTGSSSHSVSYWSVDVAGNIETAHTLTTSGALPVTTSSFAGTAGSNGWYKSSVVVTLTGVAGSAPIASTYYTLDGSATLTYATPFTVSSDAVHTITFWSVDTASNTETSHTQLIKIDATAPTLVFGTASPSANAKGWNNAPVSIPFTPSDATSGVASTNPSTGSVTISTPGVAQTQPVTVTDVAGNVGTFTSPAVKIDTTPPATTGSVSGATVTLGATDALSGVAATYYTIDGGAQTAYTVPFTVTASGANAISYWSVDNAGNVESAHALSVTVNYPSPALSSMTPSTLYLGITTTTTISVTGSLFTPASVVRWNGTALTTTYISSTSLTAVAPASLLTAAEYVNITVTNPGPGGGSSGSKQISVVLPYVTRVWFPSTVNGGASATAKIDINSPAPANYTLTLTNSNPAAATIPSTFVFPVGQTLGTFTVPTSPVATSTNVTLGASGGGTTSTGVLTVNAPYVSKISCSSSGYGGANATATVTLNAPAPAGFTVTFTSSQPTVASPPESCTFTAGATTATVTIPISPVAAYTVAVIAATDGVKTVSANLDVNAPYVTKAWFPSSVYGGVSGTAKISLNAVAPANYVIILTNSSPSAATIPATFIFPAGQTLGTFAVPTVPVLSTTLATMGATAGGKTCSGALTINPPAATKVSVSPSKVAGGTSSTGTVTLNNPAAAGYTVSLTSSVTSAATVPATVSFTAGATTATFTISTQPVAANVAVTITVVGGTATHTTTLTVTAP